MIKKRILWTSQAKKSLRKTHDFLIDNWGVSSTEKFLDTIDLRVSQIATHSELAPKINDTNYRQLIIHKNVSLILH